MTHAVITFGCRVNQADSLSIEEQLLAGGSAPAPAERADVIVVNTCSVTASADQGARQTIRRLARTNPSARIVVTGCYATREPEDVAALPNVEQVVCNDSKLQTLTWLKSPAAIAVDAATAAAGGLTDNELTTAERYGSGEAACGAALVPGSVGRTAFTLRLQTGCGEACSYCIIPSTRGRSQSETPERILEEIERVRAAGFKEIALTGVHLGSYGRDLQTPSTLMRLLNDIALRYGSERREPDVLFRISSLEPMDCPNELVSLVAEAGCFAPHFHLPLQHASDRMLAAMRRPYTTAFYARLVDDIRARMPHASIGTDLIVGFPGETDHDFGQLENYIANSPLTHLHVFPYSDRPGTEASALGERPHGLQIKERGARLRAIGAQLTRRFVLSQQGSVHRALTLEDGTLAVTGNYLKVRIPPGRPRNEWVQIRIEAVTPSLVGSVTR